MKWRMLVVMSGALSIGVIAATACGDSQDAPPAHPNSLIPGHEAGTSGEPSTSGAPSTSGTSGTPVAGTASEYCNGIFGGTLIEPSERCCSATEKADPNYAQAKALGDAFVADCITLLGAAIQRGRARVDSAAIATCAAALKAVPCSDRGKLQTLPPTACVGLGSGLQALGAPCRLDVECVAGTSCVGFTATTDGTCQTPAIGAACGPTVVDGGKKPENFSVTTNAECADGGHCESGLCVAAKPMGATCSLTSDCAVNAYCYLGKCAAQLGDVGDACKDFDCKTGLYCTSTFGSMTTGTCQPQKTAGQACTTDVFSPCAGKCVVADGSTAGTCASVCGSN